MAQYQAEPAYGRTSQQTEAYAAEQQEDAGFDDGQDGGGGGGGSDGGDAYTSQADASSNYGEWSSLSKIFPSSWNWPQLTSSNYSCDCIIEKVFNISGSYS